MGRRGVMVGAMWKVLVMVMVENEFQFALAQHQFDMVHAYARLRVQQGDNGISVEYYQTLWEHDQRQMLQEVVTFPITGDDDIYTTG
jgi:hypothetical protein